MTSPTAKANSANIDARQRLAELLIRDIKEASAAENLMISDVLTALAGAMGFAIATSSKDRDTRFKTLDQTVEVLEAMLENAQ